MMPDEGRGKIAFRFRNFLRMTRYLPSLRVKIADPMELFRNPVP